MKIKIFIFKKNYKKIILNIKIEREKSLKETKKKNRNLFSHKLASKAKKKNFQMDF